MSSNDRERQRTLVPPVAGLCLSILLYRKPSSSKQRHYPISYSHMYSMWTPYSSCRCPIAILVTLVLLRPDWGTEVLHKPVTFFCPMLLSTATKSATFTLPSPIILSVFCMIQGHLSIFLLFFKNKGWNCEGHSSIYFSGMCRFSVFESPLLSFARLREQVINNLHFWGSTEMKLQNSAILHNLPLYSYFLIFFPSPVPPIFHPTDSSNASCEKTCYKESSVLCLYYLCGGWVTVQTL